MKKIKVLEQTIFGLAAGNEITIDPRQDDDERLDTLIHESLHVIAPSWSEKKVSDSANIISSIVWNDGYRRLRPKKYNKRKNANNAAKPNFPETE